VKGKSQPVEVFSVVGPLGADNPAGLAEFEQGVLLYRQGNFTAATNAFTQASQEGLNDSLTQMYLQRCADLITQPPTDWTGVFIMKTK
jgi:adenylate cyclase